MTHQLASGAKTHRQRIAVIAVLASGVAFASYLRSCGEQRVFEPQLWANASPHSGLRMRMVNDAIQTMHDANLKSRKGIVAMLGVPESESVGVEWTMLRYPLGMRWYWGIVPRGPFYLRVRISDADGVICDVFPD